MSLARRGIEGRRRAPPHWLVGAAVVPAALVALPVGYVAVRSWEAGLAGMTAELLRPRTLYLLFNTVTLVVAVTLCASILAVAAAWCKIGRAHR